MIRILLADDQTIFRAGVARVLSAEDDCTIFGQCDKAEDLLPLIASSHDSILLLTQSLRADMGKLFAAAAARGTRILLMTETDGEVPPDVLRRIDGLVTRHISAAELTATVRRLHTGQRQVTASVPAPADPVGLRMRELLTQRELEIVSYIVQGWKNRQIAERMGTKEQVIKNYLRTIYDKTGASDRLELTLFTLHHSALAEAANRAQAQARQP